MSNYLIHDKWLSSIFGYNSYKLNATGDLPNTKKCSIGELIPTIVAENRRCFIYSKISTTDMELCNFLESTKFYLVDTSIKLKKIIKRDHTLKSNCKVRHAQQKDAEAVAGIAYDNFVYSRFHLDPLISDKLANKLKSEWAKNYFSGGRGNEMLVAIAENKIVGFLQLLHYAHSELVIDLIAVCKEMHGKGIASDLIYFAENITKMEEIVVGTQVANIPSIRLYEKLGFRAVASQYILHFHSLMNE